jgi:hypothetical protein
MVVTNTRKEKILFLLIDMSPPLSSKLFWFTVPLT